jgi:8-oxo-dGTP diphosphatase
MSEPAQRLPYRIAVLCYLYDARGHLLLLHRRKDPNAGMYSPIGGKLDLDRGESPHACAIREIHEESGVELTDHEVRLAGVVSETAYEGDDHWLLFLFEVVRPVAGTEIGSLEIDEGTLVWVAPDEVEQLDIPYTDRHIMWPLVRQHRGGFFMVDIDCREQPIRWRVQESQKA